MKRQQNWSNTLLWAIYLALLVVLPPHTAWAFGRFEPPDVGWLGIRWGMVTAWAAAFAFEAAIAALTHKLAKHIESTPRYSAGRVWLRRITYQYLNAFSAGLLVAVGVSVLANFGHAVEFGQDFVCIPGKKSTNSENNRPPKTKTRMVERLYIMWTIRPSQPVAFFANRPVN